MSFAFRPNNFFARNFSADKTLAIFDPDAAFSPLKSLQTAMTES